MSTANTKVPPQAALFLFYHGVLRPLRKMLRAMVHALIFSLGKVSRLNELYLLAFDSFGARFGFKYGEEGSKTILQYFKGLQGRAPLLPQRPAISICVYVTKDARPALVGDMLKSVSSQVYANWQLCIVGDFNAAVESLVDQIKGALPDKVSLRKLPSATRAQAFNACLDMATGSYIGLLGSEDRLTPNALVEVMRYINLGSEPEVLYPDARAIDERGNLLPSTFYKPGWSPFLHLALDYTEHFPVYRADILRKIGGMRELTGAEEHDLMLRSAEAATHRVTHVPLCLYQKRTPREGDLISSRRTHSEARAQAIEESCSRRGHPAKAEWDEQGGAYRLRFDLPSPPPLVSIIIPTKDKVSLLRDCIESIYEKSTYRHLEIIVVDNGSTCQETLGYLNTLANDSSRRVRILRDDRPYNFARLNNSAVEQASGTYVVLLNNDTKVIAPAWIEEMLGLAHIDGVGAVGCQLLYEDLTIQHAGGILRDRDIAGHSFKLLPSGTRKYHGLANLLREASFVTAAALMIAKSKYLKVGGLDEIYLPNGYGDVDFCLKLRKAGFVNIYTPHAKLFHLESKSRGFEIEVFERDVMVKRWGYELMNDPYLNPNLARSEQYEIDQRFACIEVTNKEFNAML